MYWRIDGDRKLQNLGGAHQATERCSERGCNDGEGSPCLCVCVNGQPSIGLEVWCPHILTTPNTEVWHAHILTTPNTEVWHAHILTTPNTDVWCPHILTTPNTEAKSHGDDSLPMRSLLYVHKSAKQQGEKWFEHAMNNAMVSTWSPRQNGLEREERDIMTKRARERGEDKQVVTEVEREEGGHERERERVINVMWKKWETKNKRNI